MRPGDDLSERKKMILKALIDAHIELGEPVGSKYLTGEKGIQYSSATIRNEMSELEELGYLEQPHTSAGRVPSQLGYRFYVDALMQAYSLTANELRELNNMQMIRMAELDKILSCAGKLVSSLTNYTGIAVKPKPKTTFVRCFNTIYIDSRNFVLSLVMNDETVKSKYIHCAFDVTPDILNRLSGVLNNNIAGKTSDTISLPIIMKMEEEMGAEGTLISSIIKSVYEVTSGDGEGDLKFEGVDRLLEYPEFSDLSKLKELFAMLDKKEDIMELVSSADGDKTQVYIGGDESVDIVDTSAIIFKPVTVQGKMVGAIGVIGPRRMEYSKVIAMVEYLTASIARMLEGAPEAIPAPKQEKTLKGEENDG